MSQKRKPKTAGSKRKKPAAATAVQITSESGDEHFVAIGNLRVMLFNDDGSWFAQGLEIDYAAQGDTLEEVQERFQEGLGATVDLHLRMNGSILSVLRAAPPEVWAEFYTQRPTTKRFSQVSLHLPFAGIEYYSESEAA